jgi:hypothetical protein
VLGVVVAVVAALLVIGAVVTYRMARSNDTVESFRRQIDALSPEARRGTVDQVNRIDDTTIDSTAIDSTATDDTAVGDTATGDTAVGGTATGDTANDAVAAQADAPDADPPEPPDEEEHGS